MLLPGDLQSSSIIFTLFFSSSAPSCFLSSRLPRSFTIHLTILSIRNLLISSSLYLYLLPTQPSFWTTIRASHFPSYHKFASPVISLLFTSLLFTAQPDPAFNHLSNKEITTSTRILQPQPRFALVRHHPSNHSASPRRQTYRNGNRNMESRQSVELNKFSMTSFEVIKLQSPTEALEIARRGTKCYPTYQSLTPEQQDIIKATRASRMFLDDVENLRCEVSKDRIQAALFGGANKWESVKFALDCAHEVLSLLDNIELLDEDTAEATETLTYVLNKLVCGFFKFLALIGPSTMN